MPPETQITIRDAAAEDADSIFTVYTAAVLKAYSGVIGTEEQVRGYTEDPDLRDILTARWRNAIEQRLGTFLVAAHQDSIVGFAHITPDTELGEGNSRLSAAYVAPEWWRAKQTKGLARGVGSMLLDRILPNDTRTTVRLLAVLHTAEAFYGKFGFSVSSEPERASPEFIVVARYGLSIFEVEMTRPPHAE